MSKNKKRPRLYFIPETELVSGGCTYSATNGLASYTPRLYANCSDSCCLRDDHPYSQEHTHISSDHKSYFCASDLCISPPGCWTPPKAHSTLVAPDWCGLYTGTMQDTVRSMDLDQVLSRMENSDAQHWPGHHAMAPRSPFASSQHSLVSGHSKYSHYHHNGCINCGHWNNYCKVFLITCVVLLFAWGIAVPVFFTVGKGHFHKSTKIKVAPEISVGPALKLQTRNKTENISVDEKSSVPLVPNVYNGSIAIINRRFTPDLNNPRSPGFANLRKSTERSLTNIFADIPGFHELIVKSFSPDNIHVNFIAIFKQSATVDREYIVSAIIANLLQHWTMMGLFQIDVHSLHINYLEDQCATAKGGCSHSCQWDASSASHLCLCPAQLTLDVDDRTCREIPQIRPRLVPRWPEGCHDDQFTCKNRKCIPRRWLCDEVADCPRGEDEDTKICGALPKEPAMQTSRLTRNQGPRPASHTPRGPTHASDGPPPMWQRFKTPQSRLVKKQQPPKFVIHDQLKAFDGKDVIAPKANKTLDLDAYLKNGSGRNSLHYLSTP
ncbi:hypothetical protein CAPTEDRAFT_227000 [Capitella teleta]|uniref:SEA domain-containing protein n=1 Tax=Capitella teleta TaxID=283909 RepID=R7V6X6_CAPTE|nr:hypothetical protein CAPTEDRAFT_227000 [Capitella teleta]|eukprot:ELU14623.1 hypothetical protein CAPTEDRAFT_227000 [Capitella teleta]